MVAVNRSRVGANFQAARPLLQRVTMANWLGGRAKRPPIAVSMSLTETRTQECPNPQINSRICDRNARSLVGSRWAYSHVARRVGCHWYVKVDGGDDTNEHRRPHEETISIVPLEQELDWKPRRVSDDGNVVGYPWRGTKWHISPFRLPVASNRLATTMIEEIFDA